MKVIRTTHDIVCSEDRFWELYLDDAFTRAMFTQSMGWDDPYIEVVKDDEKEVIRKMAAQPKLQLPGAVSRLISKTLGYEEDGRFDKTKKRWRMVHVTNIFGDKLHLEGIFTTEPKGDDRCVRHAEMTIEGKMFGVAGIIERAVESNMRTLLDEGVVFMNDYAKKHPA